MRHLNWFAAPVCRFLATSEGMGFAKISLPVPDIENFMYAAPIHSPLSKPHPCALPRTAMRKLDGLMLMPWKKLTQRYPKLADQKHQIIAIVLAQAIFLALAGLRGIGQLESMELNLYDFLLARQSAQMPVDQRITMVWFDDEDQRQIGHPLNDSRLLELFEKLQQHQPRVIGLDLYRDLPVPMGNPDFPRLSEYLRVTENIVGIQKVKNQVGDQTARVDPPPGLKDTRRIGFNDLMLDPGNIVRRDLLFLEDENGQFYEYFGLILAMKYLAQDGVYLQNDETGALRFGKVALPPPLSENFGGYVQADMGGYQRMLTYPGAPGEFAALTVRQVLNGQFDPSLIRDKILIIGNNAQATPDFFYTPVSLWQSEDKQRIPGAAIHAFNVSQLLRLALEETSYSYIHSRGDWFELFWLWLWIMLAALFCLWARNLPRFSLIAVAGLAGLAAAVYLNFSQGMWLPAAAPAVGWAITLALVITYLSYQERSQRAVLMSLFQKHVSKDVAEVIWRERDQYLNEGRLISQRLTGTVLFTDLQNFTTVSEAMEPQALMDWLNEYMDAMVKVVERNYGQVNKFIGDAVMALFGVPIPRDSDEQIARDAINAVNCALEMREEIHKLREYWASQNMPQIRMRVGIFTGPLVAGSLGGVERQEYTVLGDTVNIASRLESFDKNVDADNVCRILIGEATRDYLSDGYETERVGEVHLKGKHTLVTIYRVIGRAVGISQVGRVC
jgi:adenylate cyclase